MITQVEYNGVADDWLELTELLRSGADGEACRNILNRLPDGDIEICCPNENWVHERFDFCGITFGKHNNGEIFLYYKKNA